MCTHTLQEFIETVLGSGTRMLVQSDLWRRWVFLVVVVVFFLWVFVLFLTRHSQVPFSCSVPLGVLHFPAAQ